MNKEKIIITPEMQQEYLDKYPTIFDLHQAIKKKFGGIKVDSRNENLLSESFDEDVYVEITS